MPTEFKQITSKALGGVLYACKATKHYSLSNSADGPVTCVQPGDYVVVDSYFHLMGFSRNEFKKYFGHTSLQMFDEATEE